MQVGRRAGRGAAAAAGVAAMAATAGAAHAAGAFVQDVDVLHTFHQEHRQGAYFGWAVSELGDVDGDGARDAIVGEPGFRGGRGATYVYSGGSGRLVHRLVGRPGDGAGYAIADAGDADGDGVADIVSGAPSRGAGRVVLLSGATGRRLHTFVGRAAGDAFGAAVAGAGDVDGDGHADVLVGAPGSDRGGAGSGRAYVFSGRTYRPIRVLDAGDAGDALGSGTDSTADLDGDGVPDHLVSAPEGGRRGTGVVFAFSGADGHRLLRIRGPRTADQFGTFFVAGVGDTDGDGMPDIYVGDYNDSNGRGRAAVYSGDGGRLLHAWRGRHRGGMGPGREAGDVDGDGLVDLAVGSYTDGIGAPGAGKVQIFSGADGSVIRRITSTTPGENLGFDAVGMGDTDGDGRPDLLVSAATGNTVYLVAGR